jgi:hypothetical protein
MHPNSRLESNLTDLGWKTGGDSNRHPGFCAAHAALFKQTHAGQRTQVQKDIIDA